MVKYTALIGNRKMNGELRISYKKLIISVLAVVAVFIYVLNKNSCPQVEPITEILNKPVIYAVTPTYSRPVQKAELTRWVIVETCWLSSQQKSYIHLYYHVAVRYYLDFSVQGCPISSVWYQICFGSLWKMQRPQVSSFRSKCFYCFQPFVIF